MAVGSAYYGNMMRQILEHYDRKGWFERIDISISPEFLGFIIHVRYHDGQSAVCKLHSESIDELKKKIEEMSWRPYDPSQPLQPATNYSRSGSTRYAAPTLSPNFRPNLITGITSV